MIGDVAAAAFQLHAAKKLTDAQLIAILQECVNATAIENGYTAEYGMPFSSDDEDPRAT